MNLPQFFNKWWLTLVYGVLLILLSYFLFTDPEKSLSSSGIVIGFIAVLTGSVSINSSFLAGENDKNILALLYGIISWLNGLFFLSGIPASQELIDLLFLVYIAMNTLVLLNTAWQLSSEIKWWWLSIVHLCYTILVTYFTLSGTTVFNLAITLFAGLQVIINGILMIVYAFVLRKVQMEYNKTIRQIKQEQKEAFK